MLACLLAIIFLAVIIQYMCEGGKKRITSPSSYGDS